MKQVFKISISAVIIFLLFLFAGVRTSVFASVSIEKIDDGEDALSDTLDDLKDDFKDVKDKIDRAGAEGRGVSLFEQSAREVGDLLDRADEDLNAGKRSQVQRDMDEALSKLKDLNDSVTPSSGEEEFDDNGGEESAQQEDESAPQETDPQKNNPAANKNIFMKIWESLVSWIKSLFS